MVRLMMTVTTYRAITQVCNSDLKFTGSDVPSKGGGHPRRGFTLIELLVVITIIGILASIIIANLSDVVSSAEKTKTKAAFSGYIAALTQYKSEYKYYPPLFPSEKPVDLYDSGNGLKLIMALRGKKLVDDSWQTLTGDDIRYNRKSRLFHSFDEEEFDDEGYLIDTWGNRHIKIIIDFNRDGFIKLPNEEGIDELDGRSLKKDIVIYVLGKDDENGEGADVFSWTGDD